MLLRQGRIYAKDITSAVLLLRDKYGNGELRIRECNVQPKKKLICFEYIVDVDSKG